MENYENNRKDGIFGVKPNTTSTVLIVFAVIVILLQLVASLYIWQTYSGTPQNTHSQTDLNSTEIAVDGQEEAIPDASHTTPTTTEPNTENNLLNAFSVLNVEDGVVRNETITFGWQISEEVQRQFNADETYVAFALLNRTTGESVASIGDGFSFSQSAYTFDIADLVKTGRINNNDKYFIESSLRVQPSDFECDPNVQGECVPIYSTEDEVLIKKAENLSFGSETITFSESLLQGIPEPSSVTISGPSEIFAGEEATWTVTVRSEGNDTIEVTCRVSRWRTGENRFGNDSTYSDWNEKLFDGTASNGHSFTIDWTPTETSDGNTYFEISCTPWEENGSLAGDGDSIKFEVR